MGFANRAIVAAGLGFAVSALVGCGGSGSLLSNVQSSRLNNQLAQASQDLSAYHCRDAARDIRTFNSDVDSLNAVNATLIRNLDQGASTIEDLAATDCPVYAVSTTKTRSTPTKTTNTNTDTDTTDTTTTDTNTDTTTTQTEPTTTVITFTTPTDTTTTDTTDTTGTTTTDTDTTPSGGSGVGGTDSTTTSTISTGVGDGAQGTG